MKINEIKSSLTELANNPAPHEVEYQDRDYIAIVSPNIYTRVSLSRALSKDNTGRLDEIIIEFDVMGRYDITNTGNQFKIFSTVLDIVKSYLPAFIDSSTQYVSFGADKFEPSRVKLYKRFVPYISSILGKNWQFKLENSEDTSIIVFMWENERKKQANIVRESTADDQAIVRVAKNLNNWLDQNYQQTIADYRAGKEIEKRHKIRVIGQIKDLIPLSGDLESKLGDVKVGIRRFANSAIRGRYYYKFKTMTNIIMLRPDMIGEPGYHSTIAHELRHALDSIASQGQSKKSSRYNLPKDKRYWADPEADEFYRGKPLEINARLIQAQDAWADWITSVLEKYSNKPDTVSHVKQKGIASFNRALMLKVLDQILTRYQIKEYFENDQPGYRRIVNRMFAYANSTIAEWHKKYIEKKFAKKPGEPGQNP